jgi:hypothetical protein
LCGGDKSSQVKDIAKAQEYWKSYTLAKAEREAEERKKES